MMSMLSGDPHVELMKLARVHGPLMLVKFGMNPVIVASSQESAMEILRTHDKAFSGRFVPHSMRSKDHIKHSLVWTDCTDGWKNLRRIARTELFSTKMLDAHVHVRQRKVGEMLDYIRGKEGGEIKITEVVFGTLLNILGHVVFSKDVFRYGEKGDEVGMQKLIRDMLYIAATPNLADFYPFLGGLDLHGLLRACEDRLNKIELWKDTVKERRARRDPSKHDFLEVLLANDFNDAQLNAMFLTFGPGSETSSTTVEWTLAELLKHPDKMSKVQEELAREVGGPGCILTESHLPRLPYLHACIKEAMRLHPAAPFLLPHRSVEPCQVMGYSIPKDYKILINAYAIGRDPYAWEDPDVFSPERFLDSDLDYHGNHMQFIPFGAGRRICIGMALAIRTIPLFLGSLLHTFDWKLPDGMTADRLQIKEKLSLTLVVDPSLVAVPKARN
ncbi:hypothetical protein ACLOJK_024517 [Asimina triloba]